MTAIRNLQSNSIGGDRWILHVKGKWDDEMVASELTLNCHVYADREANV